MQEILSHPLIVLFAIIGLGMALGKVSIGGLSLGSSGVLFVALLAGHMGLGLYEGVGTLGLALFVYCVGVGAGGRFFAALVSQGNVLAWLALVVVGGGALVTFGLAWWLEIPRDLAAGLFAGALTSTPALAASTDYLKDAGQQVSIGYGIAYPFGVIGVVLFVQLLPRILRVDLEKEAASLDQQSGADRERIVSKLVEVTNRELEGQRISELDDLLRIGCQITRIKKGERLVPLEYGDTFAVGQLLLVVGRAAQMDLASKLIGHLADQAFLIDTERERRQLIVTHRKFIGRSLRDLGWLREYGIIISRITRLGITFVPGPDTVVDANDVVTAVGSQENLERFSTAVGHRSQAFNETDLLSLGVGITLGIFVGQLELGLPGGASLSLGLAGGPLLVGLILGHFGRVGRIVGHIPRPTRVLLQELGLVLFLAEAGIRGGGEFVETFRVYGLSLFLLGLAVTIIPMTLAYLLARYWFKLNLLQALGGICGGMTSTPALGVITAKTDSQAPVVSYATAYPVALILMTVFAKLLIQALGV